MSPYGPTVKDDNLTVEKITEGLDFPTSMSFIGNNDILVTEKNTGIVKRVLNGQVQETPALDVSVASSIERGLLGMQYINNLTEKHTFSCLTPNMVMMQTAVILKKM